MRGGCDERPMWVASYRVGGMALNEPGSWARHKSRDQRGTRPVGHRNASSGLVSHTSSVGSLEGSTWSCAISATLQPGHRQLIR